MNIKKSLPLWVVILVAIVAIAGTAAALTLTTFTPQQAQLYTGSVTTTPDLAIQDQSDVTFDCNGLNTITASITVHNSNAAEKTGSVMIQLLDETTGQIISIGGVDMEQSSSIDIDPTIQDYQTVDFTFTGAGLLDQFGSYLIVLSQD